MLYWKIYRHRRLDRRPFSMTATTMGYDNFLGRTCTDTRDRFKLRRIITLLHQCAASDEQDTENESNSDNTNHGSTTRISGIFANRGISCVPLDPAVVYAGDIVTVTGVPDLVKVGNTLKSNLRGLCTNQPFAGYLTKVVRIEVLSYNERVDYNILCKLFYSEGPM